MRLSDVGSLGRVGGLGQTSSQTPSAAVAASDAAVAESWRKAIPPWSNSGKEGYGLGSLVRRGNFVFACRTDGAGSLNCNNPNVAPEVVENGVSSWFYTGAIPNTPETVFKTSPLPKTWSYGGNGRYWFPDIVIDATPGYGTWRMYRCKVTQATEGCNADLSPRSNRTFWEPSIPTGMMTVESSRPSVATVLASVQGAPPLAATNAGAVTVAPAAAPVAAPVAVLTPTAQGTMFPGVTVAPPPVVKAATPAPPPPAASVLTSSPAPAAAPTVAAATAPMVVAPGAFAKPVPTVSSPASATGASNTTVTPFVPVGAPVTPSAAGAGVTAASAKGDERPFYMRPAVVVGALAGTAALTAFFMRKKGG